MIVEQQLAPAGACGERKHHLHRAARHHPRTGDYSVPVHGRNERHFAPAGGRDFARQIGPHSRGNPLAQADVTLSKAKGPKLQLGSGPCDRSAPSGLQRIL